MHKLFKIKDIWLIEAVGNFKNDQLDTSILQQWLYTFFDKLIYGMEKNDPSYLMEVLDNWVDFQPSLLKHNYSDIHSVLTQLMKASFEIIGNYYSKDEAMELLIGLTPIFLYSLEYANKKVIHKPTIDNYEEKEVDNTKNRIERNKADFISIAAHELKTPLTVIEGYLDMLDIKLSGTQLSIESDIYIKGIKKGADRLKTIINKMIDISLIDNNMLSLNYQPYWINNILRKINDLTSKHLTQRNLKVEVNLINDVEFEVFGDEERLLQALYNVVENSIKFTPDGGMIVVKGRKINDHVEIIISDTGIGISPENHKRIFEKFGQLGHIGLHSSSNINFKGGGPGLGLSISKGIIEAHGGVIWVESEFCDEIILPGSKFHIILPLASKPPIFQLEELFSNK